MAKLTPRDFVIDLGAGDGRLVIAAAKRGARALGLEYNADLVELSKRNAVAAGVTDKAAFIEADIFKSDLSTGPVHLLMGHRRRPPAPKGRSTGSSAKQSQVTLRC